MEDLSAYNAKSGTLVRVFTIEVQTLPEDKRSYVIQYRSAGRSRLYAIGLHGVCTRLRRMRCVANAAGRYCILGRSIPLRKRWWIPDQSLGP